MSEEALRELYLDLMKRVLVNWIYGDQEMTRGTPIDWRRHVASLVGAFGYRLVKPAPMDVEERREGKDEPPFAHSKSGLKRLDNTRFCLETVLKDGVPGDFLEAGVWRGGMSIFARAVLKAHGVTDRTVWLADSFAGFPVSDTTKYPQDSGNVLHNDIHAAVSLERVKSHFERYGLLDDQVKFLKGWFKDTLPTAPVKQLAVLRLDGDLYESTMDTLDALYPKLSPGGFCIVDDYWALENCRLAADEYRAKHGIKEELVRIDWTGVYWRRRA